MCQWKWVVALGYSQVQIYESHYWDSTLHSSKTETNCVMNIDFCIVKEMSENSQICSSCGEKFQDSALIGDLITLFHKQNKV